MKILHTIDNINTKSGGTTTSVYNLLWAIHQIGGDVDLLTSGTYDISNDKENWIKTIDNDYITPVNYSRNLKCFLDKSSYDLYHTNGLWLYCNHATAVAARNKGVPFVITPHGMLYPQALSRNAWKKRLMSAIWFRKDLQYADCIHVTCKQELEHCRNLGLRNPIAVIPNPICQPSFLENITPHRDILRIGFLGRIHPRKNIESLIDAWKLLGDAVANCELDIIGDGEKAYIDKLKSYAAEKSIKNIRFCGFLKGKEKYQKLADLTALCVPSDFENFGMIIPEALSVGTPVIASKGTPWEELVTEKCGWWIDNEAASIASTLKEVIALKSDEISQLGNNGKRLVVERYSDIKVAKKTMQMYEYLINGGTKPDFIYD